MNLEDLRKPFPAAAIEWRKLGSAGQHGQAWVAYITARAVQDRLDEVVGPARWSATFEPIAIGTHPAMKCSLAIEVEPNRWVTKEDGAAPSDIEPEKGAFSDALRRAAVQWGIGRYLYDTKKLYLPPHERPRRGLLPEEDVPTQRPEPKQATTGTTARPSGTEAAPAREPGTPESGGKKLPPWLVNVAALLGSNGYDLEAAGALLPRVPDAHEGADDRPQMRIYHVLKKYGDVNSRQAHNALLAYVVAADRRSHVGKE